uniref:protein-disulfide reductase n=1 Tax=Kalanchoe fedtschenkoi TaxID=63787 RepID=A0A7N0ZTT4_KALFE
MAADKDVEAVSVVQEHDVVSILSGPDRDFLVRNDGSQVEIASLKGKKIGLYFSSSWCGPCRSFTPKLVNMYSELSSKGDFEIIFVTGDTDAESFDEYFSKMPWLAIPFADSDTRDALNSLFKVEGIPHVVILDEEGRVVIDDGISLIEEHGVDAYPFTAERIKELEKIEAEAKKNQTLKSLLVSPLRDYVVTNDGTEVPVAELEGRLVGLYFSMSSYNICDDFTPKLVDFYEKTKAKGEDFEVVEVPLDDDDDLDEESKEGFKSRPWFTLPIGDQGCVKLARYFELAAIPTLAVIGQDGKTLNLNVADAVEEHGILAYPFTPEKFAELEELEKAKQDAQTLESILVSGDLDFVIGQGGAKVPVSDLVGKTILLSFSAHWCPPCRAFLPKLVEAYTTIKAKDEAFEVIFISSDKDQPSFDDYFAQMPWLALLFGDARKASIGRKFKVQGIPTLVAISPAGKTVTTEAGELIMAHGADAYPFTAERLEELKAGIIEMAKGWPETLRHSLHDQHDLILSRRGGYNCDGCNDEGLAWSYFCDKCDFDLHPQCALKADEETATKEEAQNEGVAPEGWICEDGVCRKA